MFYHQNCFWQQSYNVLSTKCIPKGKFPGFQENLADKLPGWGNNDGFGFLDFTKRTCCNTVRHQLLQNRQKKCSLEGEHMLNMSKKQSCHRIIDSPFYQILFGHRPWDLCQQIWLGCHTSAQGLACYNQTCWYFSLKTRTIRPHQMSETQILYQSYIKPIVLICHLT